MALGAGWRRSGAIAEINVTPMADVMIVLLIIFMMTTAALARAPVRLPSAVNPVEVPGGRLEIVVGSNGEISVSGTAFESVQALTEYVAARLALSGATTVVLVQADAEASYADVAAVLGACRRAGVEEVALAAERRPGS